MRRSRTRFGTSMIEILVVIVVFLIGILAVVQIFPGGFRLLVQARNQGVAQGMASSLLSDMTGKPDGQPEQILPVDYLPVGGNLVVQPSPNRVPNDLSPLGTEIDPTGVVYQNGVAIGYWPYVSGPNVMRRIVGESHRMTSPRSVGTDFGCLITPSFSPVLTSSDNLTTIHYVPEFSVFGSDLVRMDGAPNPASDVVDYQFYADGLDSSAATIYLPPTKEPVAGGEVRTYRFSMTVWIKDVSNNVTRRDVSGKVNVLPDPTGAYAANPVATLLTGIIAPTDTLDSVEPQSIRIARQFIPVASSSDFHRDASGRPDHAFEFKLLQPYELGQMLFSPAAYDYYESRPEGRIPLKARLNYDVFDWRIIRDDFRIPDSAPFQYKLTLSSLRVIGASLPDGRSFTGLNVLLPNDMVVDENRDFGLIDTETGGVYVPSSYVVDRSTGLISFPSTQMKLVYPGDNKVSTIDGAGRSVRAIYMGNNDWSVQLLRASAEYLQAYSLPGVGQYYVGDSDSMVAGDPLKIYFPRADLNQKVKIGEIIYETAGGEVKTIKDQDFLIAGSDPALQLPYVSITSVAPDAFKFNDAAYGYSVRDVEGISLSARTMWNPANFTLGADTVANLGALSKFQQNYHRTTMDTTVEQGGDR